MNRSRMPILFAVLVIALVLAGAVLSTTRQASRAADYTDNELLPSSDLEQTFASTTVERSVVRVSFIDQDHLDAVAGELDIWEVNRKEGYFIAAVTPAQYHWLEVLGYQVQMDEEKSALLAPTAPLDARYYYFDSYYPNPNGRDIVAFLQATNDSYPWLVQLFDIGNAWLAGRPGEHPRDIWVLRITNEDPTFGVIADKPAFFLFATIHAREVSAPELAIRYIKYLTEGYGGEGGYGLDADVTWLVDHNVVYVLVMQNPDGHWKNETDTSLNRRKNMNESNGCITPSLWGVDPNRNHSFRWGCCGGSSGNACNDTYRGSSRASEPETQAFQNFFTAVMRDQNGPNGDDEIPPAAPLDATGIFISLHSYSDLVLWPWGFSETMLAPNDAQLRAIGRKFAAFNGYNPSGFLYVVDGATDDWTYGKFGIASFTFEVGPSSGSCGLFFPAFGCVDGIDGMPRNFWAENKPAFLYAHKIARTPYTTVFGPDTADLASIPGAATPGTTVRLRATIADQRYASDPLRPIAAAEYFVDAPGMDGTGIPMNPLDGSWGGLSEVVFADIDTAGWSHGRHYLLVHGQNANGAWGPFSSVFVYIVEPGISPTVWGYVRSAADNAPLPANISAGAFQIEANPASGRYDLAVISGTYEVSAAAPGYATATVADIVLQDYQSIRQDFYLQPVCTIFTDDVEGGNLGWTAQLPWAITQEASHSPTHSWSDSPGANYANYRNDWITSPVFNLSGYSGVTVSFWHTYALEAGYDYGYFEYSTNGGSTWTQVVAFTGQSPSWRQESYALPALDGQANARLRFRLQTNSSVTDDGWHIDDILISGGGTACFTPTAPAANFSSNSPVLFGQPAQFSDLTSGTPPLEYAWDFGDGIGSSNDSNPAYYYTLAGQYTVTLTVSNSLGSDTTNQPVMVSITSCTQIQEVSLALVPSGTLFAGSAITFSADLAPDDATKPYHYQATFGDSSTPSMNAASADPLEFSHVFDSPGEYTVGLSLWNCAMTSPVTASLEVTIRPVITPVIEVDLSLTPTGTLYPGVPATFSADIHPEDATRPFTYSVDFGDGLGTVTTTTGLDPFVFSYTYATTGVFPVSIAV